MYAQADGNIQFRHLVLSFTPCPSAQLLFVETSTQARHVPLTQGFSWFNHQNMRLSRKLNKKIFSYKLVPGLQVPQCTMVLFWLFQHDHFFYFSY